MVEPVVPRVEISPGRTGIVGKNDVARMAFKFVVVFNQVLGFLVYL